MQTKESITSIEWMHVSMLLSNFGGVIVVAVDFILFYFCCSSNDRDNNTKLHCTWVLSTRLFFIYPYASFGSFIYQADFI